MTLKIINFKFTQTISIYKNCAIFGFAFLLQIILASCMNFMHEKNLVTTRYILYFYIRSKFHILCIMALFHLLCKKYLKPLFPLGNRGILKKLSTFAECFVISFLLCIFLLLELPKPYQVFLFTIVVMIYLNLLTSIYF